MARFRNRGGFNSVAALLMGIIGYSSVVLLCCSSGSAVVNLTDSIAAKKRMDRNTSQLLDQLLANYDRRLRPGFGGLPTVIDVNINVRSMGPVSEQDMAYQMDCYFRQSWVDTRLRFNANATNLEILPVSVNILDRLWKPDTHFFNGKQSYLHTVTTPNKLLRINWDGRILYSMRLTIKASCPMHLETFPMDIQTCPLKFGSHAYDDQDVLYFWTYGDDSSIKMASDMTLSQYDLIGFPAGNESVKKPGTLKHQRFSMLYANFVLRRHMGYFLINVYIPCTMLVVISWVSFWINREATADRIALGIMTVLTMAFLAIENRRDLPKVSYSTALDYFIAVCFGFVVATIIQFAGVHFFTKHGSGEVFLIPESASSSSSEGEEEDEDEEGTRSRAGSHGAGSSRCSTLERSEEFFEKDRDRCRLNSRTVSSRRVSVRSYALSQRRHSQSMNGMGGGGGGGGGGVGGKNAYSGVRTSVAEDDDCFHPPHAGVGAGVDEYGHPGCHRSNSGGGASGDHARGRYPSASRGSGGRLSPSIGLYQHESCFSKLWHCLMGSHEYRKKKAQSSKVGINSVSRIDAGSRIFFPVAFILFHIFYWAWYLNGSTEAKEFPGFYVH